MTREERPAPFAFQRRRPRDSRREMRQWVMRRWVMSLLWVGCATAPAPLPASSIAQLPSEWCDDSFGSPLLRDGEHAVGFVDDVRFIVGTDGRVRAASAPVGASLRSVAEIDGAWLFVSSDGRVFGAETALGTVTSRDRELALAAPVQRGALVGIDPSDGHAVELTRSETREVRLPWPVTSIGAFDEGRFAILPGGALAIGPSLSELRVLDHPSAVERAWAQDGALRVASGQAQWTIDRHGHVVVALATSRCVSLRGLTEARLRRVRWIEGVEETDDGSHGWIENHRLEVRRGSERASWPWPAHCQLEAHETFYARCDVDGETVLHRLEDSGWVELARGPWIAHAHAWAGSCAHVDPDAPTLCVRGVDGRRADVARPRVGGELLEVANPIACGDELFLATPEGVYGMATGRYDDFLEVLGCVDGELWARRDEHLQVRRDGAWEQRGWLGNAHPELASNGTHAMLVGSDLLSSRDRGRTWARAGRSAVAHRAFCERDRCVALSASGGLVARSDAFDGSPHVPPGPPGREISLEELRRTDQPAPPRWVCEESEPTPITTDDGALVHRGSMRFVREGNDVGHDAYRFVAPTEAIDFAGLAVDEENVLILWRTAHAFAVRTFTHDGTLGAERRFTSDMTRAPRAVVHEGRVGVQVGTLMYPVGGDPTPQRLVAPNVEGLAICDTVNETAARLGIAVVLGDFGGTVEVDLERRCIATFSPWDFDALHPVVYEAIEGRLHYGPTTSCWFEWDRAETAPSASVLTKPVLTTTRGGLPPRGRVQRRVASVPRRTFLRR